MPRFRQGPLASPPSAPSAPSSLDLNIEKERPENIKDYMRALKTKTREDHSRGTITEAERDRKIGAFESVRADADPTTQLSTIAGDATLLGVGDLAGFDFFTAGKAESQRGRKALLDEATAHARTVFIDPATTDAEVAAARRLFEHGEYYRDEKPVRETVWRALNPATGPGAAMPENYEIPEGLDPAQGLRAKAEGFIRSRQEALRARNIAAILGNIEHGVKGRKKGFSRTQREQMLHDLEGIISPSDYQTLDTALKRETDPSYEPPVPTGGTFGVRGRVGRAANEAAYTANITRLATVEGDGQNAHSAATRDFYAELGRARFEQELAVELAGPPPVTDAAERAEIEKELRREVGVKVILQSMRETDQNFERMKQEQFLDRTEKTRFERLKGWYVGMRQKYPKSSMAATIALSAAGGTAATVFLFPAVFGYATAATVSGVFATRATTGVAFGQFSRFTAPLMDKWRGKRYRKFRRGEEQVGSESADRAIQSMAGAITYANLAAEMQRASQEIQEKQNALSSKEQSFLRRAGWAAIPTVAAGLLLGVGTKMTAAETIPAGGSGSTPNWDYGPSKTPEPDYFYGLEKGPTAPEALPSAPPGGSSARPPLDTPPGPPPTSGPVAPTAPPVTPGIKPPVPGPEADGGLFSGFRKNFVESYNAAEDKWNNFWSTFTGGGAKPRGVARLDHIPAGGGKDAVTAPATGGSTPPVEAGSAKGASGEALKAFAIKDAGSIERALQKLGLNGGQAHVKVVEYIQDIKANPKSPDAVQFIEKLKKAGYSGTQIDQALRDSTPKNYSNFFEQAFRRMGKDGMVGYNETTGKMSLTEESFLKPTRPRVSHQPRVARPRPPVVIPDQPSRPSVLEAQPNAPATVAQPDLTQPNLKATGLSSRRWGTDFWNRDFKARGMTVDEFSKRMDQLQKEMAIPDKVVDYSDIVGGGANTYDIEQLGKIADQLKKAVPPGEQSTTTVEQAFQRRSLGNNPPVGRPRAAAPQARATNPVTPTQPSSSGQIRIRPGEETAQMRIEDSSS